MKNLFPLTFVVTIGLPSLQAHHGQDFLVTLDTGTPHPGQIFTTTGFDFTKNGSEREYTALQALSLGLPGGFTAGASFQIGDDGSGDWGSQSITPTLQWNTTALEWGEHSSLALGVAAGWEIPIAGEGDHAHDHGDELPQEDCSIYAGIPALYQACLLANENRKNHTHDESGHHHEGIHRHGDRHGFLRLLAEAELGANDKIAANFITVFPEGDDPAFGYALAYRHRFFNQFAAGLEATGDFRPSGEHFLYLTATYAPSEAFSLTFGAATGLTPESPDLSLQTIATYRF